MLSCKATSNTRGGKERERRRRRRTRHCSRTATNSTGEKERRNGKKEKRDAQPRGSLNAGRWLTTQSQSGTADKPRCRACVKTTYAVSTASDFEDCYTPCNLYSDAAGHKVPRGACRGRSLSSPTSRATALAGAAAAAAPPPTRRFGAAAAAAPPPRCPPE